jgi:hypothetical protein
LVVRDLRIGSAAMPEWERGDRRRGLGLLGALVAVAALLSLGVLTGSDVGRRSTAGPGRDRVEQIERLTGSLCPDGGIPEGQLEIFMVVGASDEQVAAVRAYLRAERRSFEFIDEMEAYRLGRQLFRNSPDLLAKLAPGVLPMSFKLSDVEDGGIDRIRIDLADTAGVDTVEEPDELLKKLCGGTGSSHG